MHFLLVIIDLPTMEKSSEKSVIRILRDDFAKYALFASFSDNISDSTRGRGCAFLAGTPQP